MVFSVPNTEAVEVFKIYVEGEIVRECEGQITEADVVAVAQEQGFKNFDVRDMVGTTFDASELPLSQDVVLSKVDKAGQ